MKTHFELLTNFEGPLLGSTDLNNSDSPSRFEINGCRYLFSFFRLLFGLSRLLCGFLSFNDGLVSSESFRVGLDTLEEVFKGDAFSLWILGLSIEERVPFLQLVFTHRLNRDLSVRFLFVCNCYYYLELSKLGPIETAISFV